MTNSKDKHILIIEDDDEFRTIVRSCLETEGYLHVHTAVDGEEALRVIEQLGEKLYVISLDIAMQEMDGFKVMRQLAKTYKHIVGVVVVTAWQEPNGKKEFQELGNQNILPLEYILKPCDLEHYLSAIESAIKLVQSKREQKLHAS